MGGTTAIVLVALIIACMVVAALTVIVMGAVRALEVRRGYGAGQHTHVPPASLPPTGNTVASHPMFDREQR